MYAGVEEQLCRSWSGSISPNRCRRINFETRSKTTLKYTTNLHASLLRTKQLQRTAYVRSTHEHYKTNCAFNISNLLFRCLIIANMSMTWPQAVPRFLLPKLSWRTEFGRRQSARTIGTVVFSQAQYRGSISGRKQYNLREKSSRIYREIGSSISQNSLWARNFHVTARQSRDHHFDTLKFVQRLKEDGFTEAQAVAMMKVLSDVMEERYHVNCVATTNVLLTI